jgi:hypothetical protein
MRRRNVRAGRNWRTRLRRSIPALGLLVGVNASADAAGGEYATHDVAGWTVAASKDGGGCFLTKEYDRAGRTTLLLGIDADGSNHLSVLNANWSIKPRQQLELTFRLSGERYPKQFAVGMAADGKQGFVTSFAKKFPGQFAASSALEIFRGDVPVERLSLDGSGAAVAELRICVEAQAANAKQAAGSDPSDSIPKDPFAPELDRKAKVSGRSADRKRDGPTGNPTRKAAERIR